MHCIHDLSSYSGDNLRADKSYCSLVFHFIEQKLTIKSFMLKRGKKVISDYQLSVQVASLLSLSTNTKSLNPNTVIAIFVLLFLILKLSCLTVKYK